MNKNNLVFYRSFKMDEYLHWIMNSRSKREPTPTTPIFILYVVGFFLSINIEKIRVRS